MEHFADETWTDFVRGVSVTNAASDIASAFGRWLFTMRNDTSFLAQLTRVRRTRALLCTTGRSRTASETGVFQNLQRANRRLGDGCSGI